MELSERDWLAGRRGGVDSAAETGNPPGNHGWREGVLLATLDPRQCGFLRLRACGLHLCEVPVDGSPPSLTASNLNGIFALSRQILAQIFLIISPVPLSHACHQPAKTNHETSVNDHSPFCSQVALPPAARLPLIVSTRGPEGKKK